MKNLFLIMAFLGATLAKAELLNIKARFWTNECQGADDNAPLSCLIPQPDGEAVKEVLEWHPAKAAGQASLKAIELRSAHSWGRLTVFHVFPREDTPYPPYFQVRFEFVHPARAACIQSVRQRNPVELPPLICSVWDAQAKKMFGVTLEFQPAT